jgi:ribonuclease/clavin/mitogillin
VSAVKFRYSSAVLLTRDSGREVYLVERSPDLKFFGGYWACPGGVIDAVDREAEQGMPRRSDYSRCAARELFEETGVAIPELGRALVSSTKTSRVDLRAELLDNDDSSWRDLIQNHPIEAPAAESLQYICTLTTPPFAPVRYQTEFFHLNLPHGEDPIIDHGELVKGKFFTPAAAFELWLKGELFLVPPLVFLLQRLCEFPLEQAFEVARVRCDEIARGRLSEVRHTPGIFTASLATPTLPPATTTNCYLVGEQDVYVIDPATWDASERARLFRLMDDWLAAGRVFKGVLVSHHHRDHIGSVVETAERYNLPVLAHELTLGRLPAMPFGSQALADGDRLDLGIAPDGTANWGLQVMHTPGHDRGHLVFIEDRYGAAMVGDLVSTLSTIVIDPPEGHMRTYWESLERMAKTEFGVLYPAHGPAVKDGQACVRYFLKHRREREQKLVDALQSGLHELDALLGQVYQDVRPELMPVARRSLLAGLEKLVEEDRAERLEDCWRWVE